MLTTIRNRRITAVLLTLLGTVAWNATVAVRAQQSPSTTPTTGAAAPAQAQPVQYYQPATTVQYYQPAQQQAQTTQYYQPAQTVQYYQPAQTVQYQQAASGGDAYGFTNWLNGVRAQYGLPAVSYDPSLESWAQQNNAQQNARGIGHFVMGPARRQNSAMGQYASIGAMWLSSPAHRAALLDPTIRFVGLAGSGAYWTFNAY